RRRIRRLLRRGSKVWAPEPLRQGIGAFYRIEAMANPLKISVEGLRGYGPSSALVRPSSAPQITVVSPHLDDAVFSTGAFISSLGRNGIRVRILTVFGNEPSSECAASAWDRS